jgi:hypothetical protein
MATVTPNFLWPVPTPTDLVKDGATAIEALGDSIDASLVDLKGGTTGQVLSKNSNTDMDFVWVTDAAGDITGVTAGTGISGGGTSGTVTVTNSMATAIDAKGDLVPGTGADTFARLAVGANGTVLTADSAETTGLKWAAPLAPTAIGCSLYLNANQSTANATQVGVSFDLEVYDTNSFHSNTVNPTRMTIPTGLGGKYLVTSTIPFAPNATGQRIAYVFKNGAFVYINRQIAGASGDTWLNFAYTLQLAAGDYVEIVTYQDSGSSLNILGAVTYYTNVQLTYLGA